MAPVSGSACRDRPRTVLYVANQPGPQAAQVLQGLAQQAARHNAIAMRHEQLLDAFEHPSAIAGAQAPSPTGVPFCAARLGDIQFRDQRDEAGRQLPSIALPSGWPPRP